METGGNCNAKGKSGEGGCLQFLSSTWKLFSQEIYGEVREMTPARERYVAYKIIERWLAQGHDANDIALLWNQGHTGKCKSGTNKYGVEYDSCSYVKKVLAYIH